MALPLFDGEIPSFEQGGTWHSILLLGYVSFSGCRHVSVRVLDGAVGRVYFWCTWLIETYVIV